MDSILFFMGVISLILMLNKYMTVDSKNPYMTYWNQYSFRIFIEYLVWSFLTVLAIVFGLGGGV